MTRAHIVFTAIAAVSIATMGFAAGSDSTAPPIKTQTTKDCKHGQIWDKKKKECVNPVTGVLSDDDLYEGARELAYDGQYENALKALDVAANQNDPRILNYKGFANRKAGRIDISMGYYKAALEVDPDYILTRSYMGQALISQGDMAGAKAQLEEIERRGGDDTWAYASLEKAIGGEPTDW